MSPPPSEIPRRFRKLAIVTGALVFTGSLGSYLTGRFAWFPGFLIAFACFLGSLPLILSLSTWTFAVRRNKQLFWKQLLIASLLAGPVAITFSPRVGFYHWGCNGHSKSIATPELRAQLKQIVTDELEKASKLGKTVEHDGGRWNDNGGILPTNVLSEGLIASGWGAPRVDVDATANDGTTRITVDWGGSKTGHHGFVLAPTPPEQGGGYGAGVMSGDDGKKIVFEGHMTFTHWVDDCYLMFDPD
jgi:hypothetical protein